MKINDGAWLEKKGREIFAHFDRIVARFVSNFNVRAIMYLTIIFIVALCIQFTHFSVGH